MNAIGTAMMITWAGLGVTIDRDNETADGIEVYISVPEHSYNRNHAGEEMAGDVLAARFKSSLAELGVKRLTVRYRIRTGERWTEEMRTQAELAAQKTLLGSQY